MSSYLAYLVAETVQLSGIVALFFTGICHAHYRLGGTQHACKVQHDRTSLQARLQVLAVCQHMLKVVHARAQVCMW